MHLRQVDAHPRLALDRECEPRLVDARQDLGNDETGRLAAHRSGARLARRPRARVRGDPRPRVPRSRLFPGNAASSPAARPCDTSPASDAVLNVWESSPRCGRARCGPRTRGGSRQRTGPSRPNAIAAAAPSRARSSTSPRQAAAKTSARGRSIAIVQPGSCAVEKATRWPGAPVQAAHAGEQPDLPPLELPLQRPVARAHEPREHRTAAAVQHREAVEAEVEGSAVDLEAVREQGPREYAGEAATRVASGHGHHDHAPVRAPRSQALADEGRAGLHHRHEVGAIGDVQRRPGRGGAGGAQHALSIGPAEATGERPSARRLDTLEIGTHGRGIAREHGETARSRSGSRPGLRSTSRSSRLPGSPGPGRCPRRSAARRRTAGGRGRP